MKVKIAEALMHGKQIISSPFAAVGYEFLGDDVIRLANSPAEFVSCIEGLDQDSYRPRSRSSYEIHFSRDAGLKRVREVVNSLGIDSNLAPQAVEIDRRL